MDLKRNQITVGELLDHPGARAVFQRRFPMLMKHPMLGAARTITLEQILSVAQAYVPQKKIDETLSELRRAEMQNGRARHLAAPALLYAGRRRGRRAYQRRELGSPVRRRSRAVRSVSSAVASTAGGNAHSGIRAASQAAAG
mgnify:CR=1 FL=1